MSRFLNLIIILFVLLIFFLPFIIISLILFIHFDGPVLFWSKRIGCDNKAFMMPKFRSMKKGTPQLATHLIDNPTVYIFPFGNFIRKFSLDELPQIYSVIKGDMNIVGPRPALFNQYDLLKLRRLNNIENVMPGITGWAQINGRDDLSISQKIKYDVEYSKKKSLIFDLKIIFLTIFRILKIQSISH